MYNTRKMLNFDSQFSPSRTKLAPSLSQQLNDPQVSLLSLLDDDNFVSELRNGSAQVKQFMNYKRMEELVELLTVVGDPSDKNRSYKLPLTASELLSADIPFVIDQLVPQQGSVIEQEKVVSTEEREVAHEVQDEEDDLQLSSSESSRQQHIEDKEGKAQLPTCGQQEQEFGEFVCAPVRPKKMVMVRQVVQKVTMVKREHPGLIIRLFEYFSNHINYTLTAYCCKVLISLLNKRPQKFLSTLFQYQIYHSSILNHIESRSTVQLLIRIFTVQSPCCIEDRVTFFGRIVQASQIPQELNVMMNISATISETIEKVSANMKSANPCYQLQVYFNSIPQLLEKTVGNAINEHQNVSVYSIGVLYVLLNCFPAHLDNDSIDITLFRFLEAAITKLDQALASKRCPLGVGRVRLVQVMNFILKRVKIKEYLSQKTQFLPLLIKIVRQYPFNNILHNEIFKLLTNVLTSESCLTENMLKDQILINWLYEQAKEQNEAITTQNHSQRKAYKGYLTNFCKKLKQISINKPLFSSLASDGKFTEIYHIFVQQPQMLTQIDLGGYSTHREDKLLIMTSKQQILKHYATFLANSQPPIFEFDPDSCNPILIEQLQRQLDGIDYQDMYESRPKEIVQQQKHKAELIQQNQQHKSAFWKMHLQYNIEDLLNELL